MNRISRKKFLIIVGILFTLFPIIQNNNNYIVGKNDSVDIIYNNKNLKTSQGDVLYSENFNDGIADYWTTIGGTWVVENNTYKATGTPGERVRSYYVNQSFSYYIYEGDFNLVSGNEMQIIFNIQDIFPGVDQGHYCQITLFYDEPDPRKDTAILYSTQNGQIEHIQTSYDFNNNQWYHFSVISTGATVEFYLNNSLVLSYSGLFYSFGYIGVKSMYGPTAYWDNIKVSGLNNSREIHIDGNSDWDDLKNAGDCSGNGTYSDPYVIEDLVINAGGSRSCILIENSDVYFKIENCTVYNSGGYPSAGIRLSNVSNGQLINNTANNHGYGITLESSNNNSIMGNNVKEKDYAGIKLDESNYNTISGNNANNTWIGIYFYDDCNYNTISGNTVNDNRVAGIYLENSDDNTFSGNSVNYNDYGIRLIQCDKNNISGNNACYNDEGIRCYASFNNIISENTVNNNDIGIIFWYHCQNNSILRNNVSNNYNGISLTSYYNDNNNISGNTANNNQRYGIYLERSDNNIITFNTITNNDIGIYLYYSYSNQISNNTYSGNNVDLKTYIEPTFPFEIVLIVIAIIIAMAIAGMIIYRKRASRPRIKVFEKYREKFHVTEKPIREIGLETEIKPELIIPPKIEKLKVEQEEKITEEMPMEEEVLEEEVPSVLEEIPKEVEVLPEEEIVVSAPEVEPKELGILQEEEISMIKPEKQPEELIPPEPQIIKCHFCGMEIKEGIPFCPQCGMIFKKK